MMLWPKIRSYLTGDRSDSFPQKRKKQSLPQRPDQRGAVALNNNDELSLHTVFVRSFSRVQADCL